MAAVARRKKITLADFQDFNRELKARQTDLAAMLPAHVNWDKFEASAMAAIKQNPDLLKCDPRTLFNAVEKSATDGLMPDQREGVITSYRTKLRDGSWIEAAQWNPMAWGLRKRARELDDIIIQTNVVYSNDEFTWEEGDLPHISHKPAPLGMERGKVVGAYAIFKDGDDILHREVMRRSDIDDVRTASKSPDGLLWTKYFGEACRKSVLRRGVKSVPCSEKLETVLKRDDDYFEFDAQNKPAAAPTGRRTATREVIQADGPKKDLPPAVGEETPVDEVPEPEPERPEPEPQPDPDPEPEPEGVIEPPVEVDEEDIPTIKINATVDPNGWMDEVTELMRAAESLDELDLVWRAVENTKGAWPPDVKAMLAVFEAEAKKFGR